MQSYANIWQAVVRRIKYCLHGVQKQQSIHFMHNIDEIHNYSC